MPPPPVPANNPETPAPPPTAAARPDTRRTRDEGWESPRRRAGELAGLVECESVARESGDAGAGEVGLPDRFVAAQFQTGGTVV